MNAPLDRLRPALRTSAALAPVDGPDTYVRRSAGMLLVEAVLIKDAYNPRLVENKDLTAWGLSADEVFQAARGNVDDERRAFLMEPTEHGSAVVRNLQPENNATTWALKPDFVRGMMPPHPSRPGPDDPLVFAPEPATMFIARSSNAPEATAALASAGAAYDAAADKTAPCAFVYDEAGRLQPWVPGPELPSKLREQQAAALGRFVTDVYAAAAAAFVATPEARRFTKSQKWAFNAPSVDDAGVPLVTLRQLNWNTSKQVLVPAYATVQFQPTKAEPVRATLAQIAAKAPTLIGGFVLDPSWVIITGFPNAEQLEALRA